MAKVKKQREYIDTVHIWGRIWSVGALMVLFSMPVAISAYYDAWPKADLLFEALLKIIPLYWVTSIIEVVTFTPMLGAGGAYLSFVTGNITNLKLPCALNAMEQAKVKSNSEEGEIVSTIAVASSAITTTIIIAVGVILFSPVLDELRSSETLKPAFSYVSAALFGALGASYLRKHWKISIFPVFVGITVLLIMPTFGVSTLLFVTIVAAVVGALVLSKLKIVK